MWWLRAWLCPLSLPTHALGGEKSTGASPGSGKEELKESQGIRMKLPALLHPPGIPEPRLAPPTPQLLGPGEFQWESRGNPEGQELFPAGELGMGWVCVCRDAGVEYLEWE